MNFLRGSHELIQVVDDCIGLRFWDSNDGCDKPRIEEDRLPACDWIHSDQGMLGNDRLASHCSTEGDGSVCLNPGRMKGLKPLHVLLHTRRKKVIDGISVRDSVLSSLITGICTDGM